MVQGQVLLKGGVENGGGGGGGGWHFSYLIFFKVYNFYS